MTNPSPSTIIQKAVCEHSTLLLSPSPHAPPAGFIRAPTAKRVAARTPSGRVVSSTSIDLSAQAPRPCTYEPLEESFPAPLVLPGDDLAIDPNQPPQTLRMWARDGDRNPITPMRKSVYVAVPPALSKYAAFMKTWMIPNVNTSVKAKLDLRADLPTDIDMTIVEQYLQAYFHPLPVKILKPSLSFELWDQADHRGKASRNPPKIAILTPPSTLTQIRCRSRPTSSLFTHQLSLPDLIDALMSSVPSDAYSIAMLTQHDIYEEDDDEFICGRAYGGDRVAVVSSARYVLTPGMEEDFIEGVDEAAHQWPASHCWDFVKRTCTNQDGREEGAERPKKRRKETPDHPSSPSVEPTLLQVATNPTAPLSRALSAYVGPFVDSSNPTATPSTAAISFHFRILRTLTHEILHTFGLDHCVYYACLMQSTASLREDGRIPPYLCPVCLEKLWQAVKSVVLEHANSEQDEVDFRAGGKTKKGQKASAHEDSLRHVWMVERYRLLQFVCEKNGNSKQSAWLAFTAWIESRLEELGSCTSDSAS